MSYIDRRILYGFEHYLYGEAFLGSFKGMRYRLAREPLKNVIFVKPSDIDDDPVFLAEVWPEPFSYEKTEDSLKKRMEFSFDEEGLNEAVAWLNAEYESRKDEWEHAGL